MENGDFVEKDKNFPTHVMKWAVGPLTPSLADFSWNFYNADGIRRSENIDDDMTTTTDRQTDTD